MLSDADVAYNVKLSFQVGFSEHLMVLVFCLLSLLGSGISFSLTYGSDRPFGSIGTRFRASLTGTEKKGREQRA